MNEKARQSPKNSPPDGELTVITRTYDLVLDLTRRVGRFPREHRFLLGDRMLRSGYDVLDLVIEARYSRTKEPLLQRANLRLEQLRFQIRLAHDERLLSHQQYGTVAGLVDEVGRLVGGWKRSRSEGAAAPPDRAG